MKFKWIMLNILAILVINIICVELMKHFITNIPQWLTLCFSICLGLFWTDIQPVVQNEKEIV
jgi:hypothetical protein